MTAAEAFSKLRSTPLILGTIVAVGTGLRLFHLRYLSLWNDEAFSAYYHLSGIHYMWTEGLRMESSPPLYYMALGAWMQIFGDGDGAIRSLSVAASSLAIILVYVLGIELLDRPKALLAAAAFAVSPTQIYFAQEARPYALLLLPVAATLLACARHLREPHRVRHLIGYSVGALLCIYVHATMAFFVAACGMSVLAFSATPSDGPRRVLPTGWIAANAVVALLSLPGILGMVAHANANRLAWIAPLPLNGIGGLLCHVVVGPLTSPDLPGGKLAALLLSGVVLGLLLRPAGRRASVVLIAIPCVYVALVLVASLRQPIMLPRIFCWLWIPFCLLLAHVLSVRTRLRFALAAVAALGFGVGLVGQIAPRADAKEPWRDVVHQLQATLARADMVVVGPRTTPSSLLHYAPGIRVVQMWAEGEPLTSENTTIPQLLDVPRFSRKELIERIAGGFRVVMILRSADSDFLRDVLQYAPAAKERIERRCGGQPCLWILSWGDSPG